MASDEQRDSDALGRLFDRLNAMTEDEAERFFARYGLVFRAAQEAQLAAWWEAATPEARQALQASFAPAAGTSLDAIAADRGVTRELRQEGDPDAVFDPLRGVWAESDAALRRRVRRMLEHPEAEDGSAADPSGAPATSFGARLRELRKAAGVSQVELAAVAGINHTYLSKIEHDACDPPSERAIAQMAVLLCPDDHERGNLRRLREELLLRAGKIPADIRAIICAHPESLALLRERYGAHANGAADARD